MPGRSDLPVGTSSVGCNPSMRYSATILKEKNKSLKEKNRFIVKVGGCNSNVGWAGDVKGDIFIRSFIVWHESHRACFDMN